MYSILVQNLNSLKEVYAKNSFDLIPLIIYCVDKSTIRSFQRRKGHQVKYKPLSIFRTWAFDFLTSDEALRGLNEKGKFEDFRISALQSLMYYWKNTDGGQPEFYQFNKLIDLLFKCLPLWNKLDNETKSWIFNNANVPLDKFSLTELIKHTNTVILGKSPSMNSITIDNYNLIQNQIRLLCKDIPPLVFDLYAWDQAHIPPKAFSLIKLDDI